MPAPLGPPVRRLIYARWQQGRSPTDIAFEFDLAARTVRRLCQQFHDRGDAALAPAYRRPGPAPLTEAVGEALAVRDQHPTWGAAYILLNLRQRRPGRDDLPSERTLQRRLRGARQPPAPPGRKPPADRARAARPHEVWQMDAVEQCPLRSGQLISWLRWVDEYSGAVLGTVVFPPRDVRPGAGDGGGRRPAPGVSAVGAAGPVAGR
jgi:hypothetical protein